MDLRHSRTRATLRFLRRHVWSLSLSALGTLTFLHLASEIREKELGPFDEAVAGMLAAWRGRPDGLMLALTTAGSPAGMASVCGISVLLLFVARKRREAYFVLACGVGALLLNIALKLIFHRDRPGASLLYLIQTPTSFSFPSGHALGSISIIGSLAVVAHALRLPRLWQAVAVALAVLFALGVAASRVYFGVHFASDVIGGELAGAALVAAMTGWFYPRLLPGESSGEGRV